MAYNDLRYLCTLCVLACLCGIAALGGCDGPNAETDPVNVAAADRPNTTEEAPLLLNDEPLLLLDDAAEAAAADGPVADNSRCFVCHINYMAEEIAVTHARANIGCADCHGPSDAHIADESWASGGNGTPPDTMFPKDKINTSCMACHPRDKIDTPQHEALFADPPENKACTDCHGDHRLPQRRCKWK